MRIPWLVAASGLLVLTACGVRSEATKVASAPAEAQGAPATASASGDGKAPIPGEPSGKSQGGAALSSASPDAKAPIVDGAGYSGEPPWQTAAQAAYDVAHQSVDGYGGMFVNQQAQTADI